MKSLKSLSLLAGLAIAALAAIGLAGSGNAADPEYVEVEVADGGSITGRVSFEGALPTGAVEQIQITKNNDVCGDGNREVVWIDVADGALRGTFVFLDRVTEGKPWAKPEFGEYVVLQKDCRFTPWAQVMRPGPVIIRNDDAGVLHNINAREMIGVEKGHVVKKTLFNFGQPDVGAITDKVEPRRSQYVAINCEAHNFMFGFIMAPTHPYAVVVGDDGSYSLDGVPPGTYTLKAWHPTLGLQETEVTVAAQGAATADFVFTAGS